MRPSGKLLPAAEEDVYVHNLVGLPRNIALEARARAKVRAQARAQARAHGVVDPGCHNIT